MTSQRAKTTPASTPGSYAPATGRTSRVAIPEPATVTDVDGEPMTLEARHASMLVSLRYGEDLDPNGDTVSNVSDEIVNLMHWLRQHGGQDAVDDAMETAQRQYDGASGEGDGIADDPWIADRIAELSDPNSEAVLVRKWGRPMYEQVAAARTARADLEAKYPNVKVTGWDAENSVGGDPTQLYLTIDGKDYFVSDNGDGLDLIEAEYGEPTRGDDLGLGDNFELDLRNTHREFSTITYRWGIIGVANANAAVMVAS